VPDLRSEGSDAALRCDQAGLRGIGPLARLPRLRLELGEPFARLGAGCGKRLVARDLLRRERGFRAGRVELRLRLRDRCLLLGDLRARGLGRGGRRPDLAGDLLGLRSIFAGVELVVMMVV
jgi:hypothetical protein